MEKVIRFAECLSANYIRSVWKLHSD